MFKKRNNNESNHQPKTTKKAKSLDTDSDEEENFLTFQSTIDSLNEQMQHEIEMYNKSKAEVKKRYSSIMQIMGALDVLTTLSEEYELVKKIK
jgi:hypothetical protein